MIFEKSFRKDLENFEYAKKYIPDEHKWDRLKSGEKTQEYYDARERINFSRVKRNRVQSDPETTGQHGTMI